MVARAIALSAFLLAMPRLLRYANAVDQYLPAWRLVPGVVVNRIVLPKLLVYPVQEIGTARGLTNDQRSVSYLPVSAALFREA